MYHEGAVNVFLIKDLFLTVKVNIYNLGKKININLNIFNSSITFSNNQLKIGAKVLKTQTLKQYYTNNK